MKVMYLNCSVQVETKSVILAVLNALIIHEEKTKVITTVKEVWICDLNCY